jgi:hypothetical protein
MDSAAERRDAALLALGVETSCRRSELAGLDRAKRRYWPGVIEMTSDGATITLFVSKPAQEAGDAAAIAQVVEQGADLLGE